jgi:hypothetical protein
MFLVFKVITKQSFESKLGSRFVKMAGFCEESIKATKEHSRTKWHEMDGPADGGNWRDRHIF